MNNFSSWDSSPPSSHSTVSYPSRFFVNLYLYPFVSPSHSPFVVLCLYPSVSLSLTFVFPLWFYPSALSSLSFCPFISLPISHSSPCPLWVSVSPSFGRFLRPSFYPSFPFSLYHSFLIFIRLFIPLTLRSTITPSFRSFIPLFLHPFILLSL